MAILVINVLYFSKIYSVQESHLKNAAINHVSSIDYSTDDQVSYPKDEPYDNLTPQQKIASLLQKVKEDKATYWLAHTEISEPNLKIKVSDFLPPVHNKHATWHNKPTLFYDPRFTLTVVLSEVKHQYATKNPRNVRSQNHMISIPFAWSDWVDLTALNLELEKPLEARLDCGWLQSQINKPTKFPDFCVNNIDVTDEEIAELGFKDRLSLPGFVVKKSPMNKAPHEMVVMQGKSHLLTYQENPLSIVFLTKTGTYDVQVSSKRRIVHSEMFDDYLERNNINANHLEDIDDSIVLNPIKEFESLQSTIPPRPLRLDDDIFHMNEVLHPKQSNASRELHLDLPSFNYRQEHIQEQIDYYETRLRNLKTLMTNELQYDPSKIEENLLTRHELNHYHGLKYASSFGVLEEPTYYKLATLLKDENNADSGWHNEWRFFNGALRYLRKGYTQHQLEIREQIILDRLLRNWFRFTQEKGIVSWLSHGPLLSWYWDGLMFPFDIDIDIQMPSAELNRLTANYNMTLVVEDISEGYGKYLLDCSTFLHHRDVASKDNHIDARFIDVDTGTYIDITGLGRNNETAPPEFESYIRNKNSHGKSVELYMDRRKHWINYEKISPLKYSMLGGVPVFIPNDFMSLLNLEYSKGTSSYYFDGYYYVPCLRLWLREERLVFLFPEEEYRDGDRVDTEKLIELVKNMSVDHKLRLLEQDEEILIEYYLTHKHTTLHEVEKKLMLDASLQHSVPDLSENSEYNQLTSKFSMGKPLRKPLFDYEFIERLKHAD